MTKNKENRYRLDRGEEDMLLSMRNNHVVGIIGDTHLPFEHKGYLDFCVETFNKFGVDTVVHIGDLVDNHAICYHEQDPNGMSASLEAEKAQRSLFRWYKEFPDVTHMLGNHDSLVARKAMTAGMPKKFFKTFEEIWQFPEGWHSEFEVDIDGVKYIHGTGKAGVNAAIQWATDNRQSTVIGHSHSGGGISYRASKRDLIFGLNVGCGIDINAYAMAYGKNFSKRPTLGCGIVINGKSGHFIPMEL
jgi:predicted phosphodiesterase